MDKVQSMARAKDSLKFSLGSKVDTKKLVAIPLGGDYFAVGAWYYTNEKNEYNTRNNIRNSWE